ncbi:MAG TPA: SRPBCC family protein [Candidatus Dormibacteraeota bacterium]|nr:SRPBCC family protein [Candidatus Dormibacteraeota bacterium]
MASTVEFPSEADVTCSAGRVFDLIIDFDGYSRWLTTSSAYHGTHEISANPVTLGTTYREPGPLGVRNGEVTEFERPVRVGFHQPMTMKYGAGVIDVTVRYTLRPNGDGTHVRRVVTVGLPWQLKPFASVVLAQFRDESARTLAALKAYADKQPR